MANGIPAAGMQVGGDSDPPAMVRSADRLEGLGVAYEIETRYRNPGSIAEYAGTVKDRSVKVLSAGGMAASFAGAIAWRTTLPVVRIPAATVAVNGSANAAQPLVLSDDELPKKLEG